MDTGPQPLELPQELEGENRLDPAKAAANVSTNDERLETGVQT